MGLKGDDILDHAKSHPMASGDRIELPPRRVKSIDDAVAGHERKNSREDSDSRRSSDSLPRRITESSPAHRDSVRGHLRAGATGSPLRSMGDPYTRRQAHVIGSQEGGNGDSNNHSRSSLQPRQHAKVSSISAPGTPYRSARGTSRGDEPLEKPSPPLPKFGDWDPKDPTTGDGFSFIFSKAKDEKMSEGSFPNPGRQSGSPPSDLRKSGQRTSSRWCFCM